MSFYRLLLFGFSSFFIAPGALTALAAELAGQPDPYLHRGVLPEAERNLLAKEFGSFSSCLNNRPVVINDQADARSIRVLVTDNISDTSQSCAAHGSACYDPDRNVIFMDYDVLYTPFISRQVGTQWESRTSYDNRVRLYRQFAFLHELGHKDKNHANRLANTERRTLESEADTFAIECFARSFENSEPWNRFLEEIQAPNQ